MTNKPEPNTRAGEALPCPWCSGKAFAQLPSLGHSSWRVVCDDCCAEGPTVPSYNVEDPEAFCIIAWNNRAGNVALPTWDHYAEEHVNTRPLPQPSELVAEVKRLTALADDHFRNARRLSEVVVARDAQIAKLQADGDKLAAALERSRQGWSNVLELGLLPVTHEGTALDLGMEATQALIEWKDRP